MNPLPNCEKFIKANLSGLGVKVYAGKPPSKGAEYPCLVMSLYDHEATGELGGFESVLELPVYSIKAVASGTDFGAAHLLMSQVDDALSNARGEVTWETQIVTIQGVRGLTRFELEETGEGGTEYRHVGRTYRFHTSRFRRTIP